MFIHHNEAWIARRTGSISIVDFPEPMRGGLLRFLLRVPHDSWPCIYFFLLETPENRDLFPTGKQTVIEHLEQLLRRQYATYKAELDGQYFHRVFADDAHAWAIGPVDRADKDDAGIAEVKILPNGKP